MAGARADATEFKRQAVEEHPGGGTSLNQPARRRHDISRELLRSWVREYEAGKFTGGRPTRADRRAYEAKIGRLDARSASRLWSWTC